MKIALIISVSALALVACNDDSASNGDIAITPVDEATAASALEALHLANSGDGVVSWDSRSFDDGVYTFTGLTFVFPEDEEKREDEDEEGASAGVEFSTNTMTAESMTLASPRFDADGNVIFDRLAINAMTLGTDDDEFDGTIDGFVIEQPSADLVATLAHGFSGDASGDDGFDEGDWTYGLFAVEGVNIAGTEDGNSFTARLGRLAIDDLTEFTIGRFELLDFAVEGMDDEVGIINFRVDEMSADGIGEGITYPFAAQFAMMGSAFSPDTPNEDVTAGMPEMPEDFDPLDAYDSATIRGLNANIGGITVTLDSLTANVDDDGDEVRYVSEMTPLVIAPDANYPLGAQMQMGLGMLGYQQLELVSEGASVYEREADRAYTDGGNYFEMRDGFRVEVESDMSGLMAYSLAALQMGYTMDEPDPEQVLSLLDPLVLRHFVFRLEDLSLLDRALTAASAMQGMPKEQLRMQAGAMITMGTMAAPAEIPRALLTEFSTAMTNFIANGGTVEVRIAPDNPVRIADLVAQAEAGTLDYEAMGISITSVAPEGDAE